MRIIKKISISIILIIVTVFATMGSLIADVVPDNISIENEGYKQDKKPAVIFSHRTHFEDYEVACKDCHHVYDGDNNIWKEGDPVQKCSDCHSPNLKQGDAVKLRKAFHKSCKDCHKEVDPDGKAAPSKKCSDCHEKN